MEALATRAQSLLADEPDIILARLLTYRATMNGDASLLVPTLTWFLDTNDEGRLVEYFQKMQTYGRKSGYKVDSLFGVLPKITAVYRALHHVETPKSSAFEIEN